MRNFGFFVLACTIASSGNAQDTSLAGRKPLRSLNPDISVNLLTLYKQAKRQGADKTESDGGLSLQEAEIQITADVDPYLRAAAIFAIHPEHEHEHEEDAAIACDASDPACEAAEPEEKAYGIEPEEAYLETMGLPYVTFKAGRFRTALGKHNSLHTHAFPFIDAPLIQQSLLGEEGSVENGLSAAVLIPAPWFLEATVQAVQGDSPELFASESSSDSAAIYRLRNLWDLSDASTLDFGLSGASGQNFYNESTTVQGADLSFKWRPTSGARNRALILSAEYLQGKVEGRPENSELSGYATWIQYQFAERWWIQARTEEVRPEEEAIPKQKKNSALIGFFPTEFSGFRLQYDRLDDGQDKALNSFLVQANVVIGAHPAHSY